MRVLYLSQDASLVQRQLKGETITLAQALPLRDDVSTDEITPVAILSHYDERLGDFAHTGTQCQGVFPIGQGVLKSAGFQVIVAGKRYGKGSSREHSPTAEKMAGVRLVIAESFERIYRQNADNIGLMTSTDYGHIHHIENQKGITLEQLTQGREPLAAAILRAGGLLTWGQHKLQHAERLPSISSNKPMSLFEKILSRHQLKAPHTPDQLAFGVGVFVQAHWRFIHEYYTGMANTLMEAALGTEFVLQRPDQIVVFEDHSSYVNESPTHVKNGLIPNM